MDPPPKPDTYSSVLLLTSESFQPPKGFEMSTSGCQTRLQKGLLPYGVAARCQENYPCIYCLMSQIAPKTVLTKFTRKQEMFYSFLVF